MTQQAPPSFAPILGNVALTTNRPKKGFTVTAGIVLGIVVILLSAAILLPILQRVRTRAKFRRAAKQAKCAFNLYSIGKGLIMYARENEDKFPATLENLIDYGISQEMLRSPSDNIERDCSYFYLAPTSIKSEVPRNILVACSFKDVHHGFRSVLEIDGIAYCLSNAKFQAKLTKPYNARFAAALKKAEGP